MSFYETIEAAYLDALKNGFIPTNLLLTDDGLAELINDRTLGASWIPSIPDFWDQRILGLPLVKSAANALKVNDQLIFIEHLPLRAQED